MNYPFPTWIEIDLSAIAQNTRRITEAAQVPLLAVVKDDGYGHGAAPVARTFLEAGGSWLGVARCHEGVELRQAGITAPIVLFGGILPEEAEDAIRNDLVIALYDPDMIPTLSEMVRLIGKQAVVHLKIDTGMGRFGVFPEDALSLAQKALKTGNILIDGVFSHFASAGEDFNLTALQMERFDQALGLLSRNGIEPRWIHIANSSAIVAHPEARYNLVRVGGILYGLHLGFPDAPLVKELHHGFTWKARLMSVKRMRADWTVSYGAAYNCREGEIIGVIPVGHGDGFRRVAGNEILVGERRVPVVGSICMDQFMVSLPEWVEPGSEVVLIGQQGEACITPEEVRDRWTSTYSGVFLVHPRVPRIYI
jgi:alanine racemase